MNGVDSAFGSPRIRDETFHRKPSFSAVSKPLEGKG
jgi:hypothetical protein